MRKTLVGAAVLLMFGWVAGCDSGSDDNGRNDAEVFIGTWTLTNLLLDGQDVSALLLAGTSVEAVFEQDNGFTLTLVDAMGQVTTIAGTYQIAESQRRLTLNSPDLAQAVTITYEVENENRIRMSTDQVELLTDLSGINPEDLGLQVDTITLIVRRKGS